MNDPKFEQAESEYYRHFDPYEVECEDEEETSDKEDN